MKSLQNIPRAAFTLIELLVVITIIAVLASMAVPAANVVIRKARETQARAIMTGLIMGIKAYQTEYNRFPDPSATPGGGGKTSDEVIAIDGQDGLMPILHPDQSQPVAANSPNPRRINFYDPPPAKGNTNGYIVTDGSLVDPWNSTQTKHPFRVAMDYGGDGAIDQALDPFGDAPANIQTQVIAWSTGYPVHPPAENDASNASEKTYFLCTWR
jgi:prepilin-type N-terminal cleavage/methylation domain-containing protein